MKRPPKWPEQMTKKELIRCIKALEKGAPAVSIAFEHERLLHELQVHQVELETQNRELREAQLLLEASRDRYADLYDFAPVGYVTFDDKGVVREINLTAAGMFGVERTRLVGVPFHLHVAREDLAQFRQHLRRHESPEKQVTTELRLARKDGSALPVVMQSGRVYDAEKGTHLCRAALTDITDRKHAEQAARQAAELNQGILSSLSAHIAVLDKAGNIIAVNEAWIRFARENGDETLRRTGVGTNYLDVCLQATGVSAAEAQQAREGIQSVLKGARPEFGMDYRCDSPAEKRWFHLSVTPLSAAGDGAVISHLNISRIRLVESSLSEKEAHLRAILDTAVEGIITIDERGTIESFNQAAEKLFGYAADEAIGQNVSLLMPSPYREQHDGYLSNYRDTGERKIIGIGREVSGRRKDDSVFPMQLSVGEVRLAGRRIFTGIVRDITERKKLEEALLDAAEREQRKFGHELHDGLGQRLTGLEMLSHVLAEDLKGHAKELAKQARRLNAELRETVTEARLISHSLAPVPLDGDGLMLGLRELALRTCRHKGVKCRFQCGPPVRVEDQGVATHLYRIAQEAVTNALKHGKAKTIEIRLSDEAGVLKLCVENDGRPLSGKGQSRNGVGLNAMRYRAGLIGGALSIESGKRKGVKVSCTLRMKK